MLICPSLSKVQSSHLLFIITILANTIDTFKNRLVKFWKNQDMMM